MPTDLNPQFPYYVLLFLLTIILRFIRAYRTRPPTSEDPEEVRKYRARYLYFGFELVNVSAGVFILLSEHATKYVAAVMILYVILVILGFFFEEESVGLKVRMFGHVGVSAVVLMVTLYAFFAVDGLRTKPQTGTTIAQWRVSLPYIDSTLNRHFGIKSIPVQTVFVTTVSATGRSVAISQARQVFFSEKGPQPFAVKTERSPLTMIILETDVVAESL